MTKQELQKLSRLDLIEMLLEATRENENLHNALDETRARLDARESTMKTSGTMAEATLRLNGVLEAAQAAADQYLENLRMRDEQQQFYSRMKQDTLERCSRMVQAAQTQADDYLRQVKAHLQEIMKTDMLEDESDDVTDPGM